jgi:hypothetical protein
LAGQLGEFCGVLNYLTVGIGMARIKVLDYMYECEACENGKLSLAEYLIVTYLRWKKPPSPIY